VPDEGRGDAAQRVLARPDPPALYLGHRPERQDDEAVGRVHQREPVQQRHTHPGLHQRDRGGGLRGLNADVVADPQLLEHTFHHHADRLVPRQADQRIGGDERGRNRVQGGQRVVCRNDAEEFGGAQVQNLGLQIPGWRQDEAKIDVVFRDLPDGLMVGQRHRSTVGVMVTQACLVYTTYLFASWLPSFLQSWFDLGVGSTGLYTAVPYLLTVVLQLTVARVSDVVIPARLIPSGARRYFIAAMILVALSVLAAPFAVALWQVMIIVTLVLTGSTSASSLNFTLASDLLRNPRDAGRITSMVAFGGNSSGLISSIITGYIVAGTGAYSWACWVAGALLCLGAGCMLLCTRRPIAAEHGSPMISMTGA